MSLIKKKPSMLMDKKEKSLVEVTSLQLKKMQKLELQALEEFISLCQNLGLTYYLLGGTMLGAVRHKGFIPWDDDIDVGMPRKDYDTFVNQAQKYISSNYYVQTHKSDPEYPFNFAKIRINNTTYIESKLASKSMNHGIYIDVFPLDVYPDNSVMFNLKKIILDLRISYAFSGIKPSIKGRICRFFSLLLYPTIKVAVIAREKHYKSAKSGKRIANLAGAWGKKEIVPAEWYGSGTKLMFEGIEVVVPQHYDLWLSQVYGDYMTLPPEEKRKPHHYVVAIDTERSYKEYINR